MSEAAEINGHEGDAPPDARPYEGPICVLCEKRSLSCVNGPLCTDCAYKIAALGKREKDLALRMIGVLSETAKVGFPIDSFTVSTKKCARGAACLVAAEVVDSMGRAWCQSCGGEIDK